MDDPKLNVKKTKSQGRMIRIDIAEDVELAKLSDGAARLYFHITPFLSSYGKCSGGPYAIRENIVPHLGWSAKRILGYLVEINAHTSYRVWRQKGRVYIHDVSFFEKQVLRDDRKGRDLYPNFPGSDVIKTGVSKFSLPELIPEELPDEVPHEVEVEVQSEEEGEGEFEASRALPLPPSGGDGAAASQVNTGGKGNESELALSPELIEWGKKLAAIAKEKQEALGIDPEEEI